MFPILQKLSFCWVESGEDFPLEEMKVWLYASFALIAHFPPEGPEQPLQAGAAHSPMHGTSLSLLFSILSCCLFLSVSLSLSSLYLAS